MTVYLDLLILDNFCADAALLYCAVKTVKGEVRFRRILLAALLGTALGVGYTIFKLYFRVPAAVDLLVKYGVAAALPLLAVKCKRRRTYALCSLAFVGYMFALAGLLTALFSKVRPNESGGALTYTLYGLPSGVLVLACVAFAFGGAKAAGRFIRHGRALAGCCTCKLVLRGQSVETKGFVDTGNRLCDRRGRPVAVAERAVAMALFKETLFTGVTPAEKIAVQTVNGISMMAAFRIDVLEIYCGGRANIIEDVTIAVSPQPLSGEYGLILPPPFAREEDFEIRR